jgi:hypothetical protein
MSFVGIKEGMITEKVKAGVLEDISFIIGSNVVFTIRTFFPDFHPIHAHDCYSSPRFIF